MAPTQQGSIRLFQFSGIQVFLHWSWFVVALIEFNFRSSAYRSLVWNVLEYLALFGIVLLHEFGHSLACRQVGGRADQIVLWPLGGVAYVAPPQRPGAMLWSIAAGPLVNVALMLILGAVYFYAIIVGVERSSHSAYHFIEAVFWINTVLLGFNLLPIYPLDGGQILRSLLWFIVGRARSLMISAVIGFIAVGVFVASTLLTAIKEKSLGRNAAWLLVMAAFVLMNCWGGLMQARILGRVAKLPRRQGFACPSCHQSPPLGALWRCAKCFKPFDTFETGAVCPHCGASFPVTQCLDCGEARPISEWSMPPTMTNRF